MGLFFRRRRPAMRLAAGAATAGVAYHMGKEHAQNQQDDQQQAAAAPAPDAAPAAAPDAAAELERLAALHQSGALTDEEFAAAKAKVLGT
jgi:membrane protease subunit (stomatin/prohibitin family)